jgi:hypothetical protein
MMTFQEWPAMLEGLWLNDRQAVVGMSNINPYSHCWTSQQWHPSSINILENMLDMKKLQRICRTADSNPAHFGRTVCLIVII